MKLKNILSLVLFSIFIFISHSSLSSPVQTFYLAGNGGSYNYLYKIDTTENVSLIAMSYYEWCFKGLEYDPVRDVLYVLGLKPGGSEYAILTVDPYDGHVIAEQDCRQANALAYDPVTDSFYYPPFDDMVGMIYDYETQTLYASTVGGCNMYQCWGSAILAKSPDSYWQTVCLVPSTIDGYEIYGIWGLTFDPEDDSLYGISGRNLLKINLDGTVELVTEIMNIPYYVTTQGLACEYSYTPVPAPSTILLFMSGIVSIIGLRKYF